MAVCVISTWWFFLAEIVLLWLGAIYSKYYFSEGWGKAVVIKKQPIQLSLFCLLDPAPLHSVDADVTFPGLVPNPFPTFLKVKLKRLERE